jgi:hypothetical protein
MCLHFLTSEGGTLAEAITSAEVDPERARAALDRLRRYPSNVDVRQQDAAQVADALSARETAVRRWVRNAEVQS